LELSTAARLIEKGISQSATPQKWVDLGAGTGLFTNALASLLGAGNMVYAVDKDSTSLNAIKVNYTQAVITKVQKNFIDEDLNWEKWDGVLMANALHFASDPLTLLHKINQTLQPNGRLIVVEYNTDKPNPWVPYPVSFLSLTKLVKTAGFTSATLLDEERSLYNRATIYSAMIQ